METEGVPESKEATPDPEVVEFLYVKEDGEVDPKIEIAVYVDARERAIYRGAVWDPSEIGYDRTEIRGELDSEAYERADWRAGRMRGSSPPKGLRTARNLALDTFQRAARVGFLLVSEEVAAKRRENAETWIRARLKALATLELDDSTDVLELTQSALQALHGVEEQVERVRRLKRSVETLGNLTRWAGREAKS